jgi:hypothetical protein
VTKEFDDKNEINKARNSPFKDYVMLGDSFFGSNWTSPWTNSKDVEKLVTHFNDMRYRKTGVNSQNIAQIANLGYEPEDVVLMGRRGTKYRDMEYRRRSEGLIDDYRRKIMADIKVLTTTA